MRGWGTGVYSHQVLHATSMVALKSPCNARVLAAFRMGQAACDMRHDVTLRIPSFLCLPFTPELCCCQALLPPLTTLHTTTMLFQRSYRTAGTSDAPLPLPTSAHECFAHTLVPTLYTLLQDTLDKDVVARLRKTIVNAILCTDMSNHFNMTQDFCKHSPEVGCDGGAGDSRLGTVGLGTVGRAAAGMEAVGMGTWVAAELLCDTVGD